jgi:MraZ protein
MRYRVGPLLLAYLGARFASNAGDRGDWRPIDGIKVGESVDKWVKVGHDARSEDRQSHEGKNGLFTNRAFHTVDGKGRLVLPSQYRKALEGADSVVLAPHEDKCLMLLRLEDFRAQAEKRKAEATTTAKRNQFRYFMSHAQQVDLDKAGRLILNEEFRQFADIELGQEVAIVGMYDYAEIWNLDAYRNKDARAGAGFRSDDEEDEPA